MKVAIVSVTSRLTDPGAPKRPQVMVDRHCVALHRLRSLTTRQ